MMFEHPAKRIRQASGAFIRGRRIALALSAAFAFLLPQAYADDWVTAFHDSRHTGQTSEVVTPPLTLAWTWKDTNSYDTGDGGKFSPAPHFWLPIYYQGYVYLQGGNNADRVFCLNPANGAQVWQWANPGYAQAGTYLFQFDNYPTAVNGRIVNASTDFTASFDATTGGNIQTSYNTNGGWPYGGTSTWNHMAYIQYVRTDDGTESFHVVQDPVAWLLADLYYAYYTPDQINTFTDDSFRVPAVDNYTAYVNLLGRLNAFDAITGWPRWTFGGMDFGSSPAVSNGIVYFYVTSTHHMEALNAAQATVPASGAAVPVLWSVPMPDAYSPIVSDGTLYVGGADGNFYALDAATGNQKWTFHTGKGFSSLQIPAISGGLIYVPGADGVLYALQTSTGAEVWHYSGVAAWGPVIIAGGMVFASDLTNTFYAFQPQTAAIGPAVTASSVAYGPNNAAVSVNLTGSGFFAGGSASAVQSVYLDNSAGTPLTGYTVASDETITGAVIPAGVAPGVYHIKVQTSVGRTVNEPTFTAEAVNAIYISALGYSSGPNEFGTNFPFQRHLGRFSDGTLVVVYIGPNQGEPQYPTYNFSFDGGLTWSGQGQLVLSNQGTVIYNPSASIWIDAQDQIDISSIQWPGYMPAFQKFAINALGVLSEDSGFPVYPSGGTAVYPGPLVGEPGGRLWLALDNGGIVTGYYSDNGGLTWSATSPINQKSGSPPTMVLYQGHPAVIYSDGGSLAWSAWNGQAWTAPLFLPGPITGVEQAMSAVVTTNSQVSLVYSPSSGGVYYTQYSGQSWSLPVALDGAGTSPSLTTDGTNLWAFYANSGGDLVYRRTSGGQWNSVIAVTSDGNHNTAPTTLSQSQSGQVPVVWTSGSPTTGYQVKAAVITGATSAVPPSAALTVTKTNTASFHQGQIGATYTVTVGNAASAGPTTGTVTVTDSEPAGLTLVAMSGSGWVCAGANCTRSDALSGGSSYPPIAVTVNVAANAAATLTSQVSVSGGGSATAAASDVTSIQASPVLTVTKTNAGSFQQGQIGATYTVTVGNAASAGPTAGTVTVTDSEPAGLTLVAMSGAGWGCEGATCTRSDALNGGSSYPAIAVTVNVAANAAAILTSQVSVSGGGSATAAASDVTSIQASAIPGCTFTVPATVALTNSVPASGTPATQSFSFAVTPSAACTSSTTWTAASSSTTYWLTITSGATGNGGGVSTVQGNGLSNTETTVRTGTITITPSTGSLVTVQITQSASPAATLQTDLEITALYQTVLGRDPDSSGYNFWVSSGLPLGALADGFLTSPEAFDNDFGVMAAYQAATGAPPGYAAFMAALSAVRAGTQTVPDLFTSLAGNNSAYSATNLYMNLLGRLPAAPESSACQAAGLATCFQTIIGFPSPDVSPVALPNNEFQSTGTFIQSADHTNGLYITMLYYTILGRNPDQSGYDFWLSVANSGGPGVLFQGNAGYPTRVLITGPDASQGFTGSPEFQSLFQ